MVIVYFPIPIKFTLEMDWFHSISSHIRDPTGCGHYSIGLSIPYIVGTRKSSKVRTELEMETWKDRIEACDQFALGGVWESGSPPKDSPESRQERERD